ncbi:MAG: PAS domain S-box protein [Candidatus Thiodiazotropha sp. L084R]
MNKPPLLQSIEILPWDESFNTGLVKIDEQHKNLVRLLNSLVSEIIWGTNHTRVDSIFDELLDYSTYHFETEEVIWDQYLANDPEGKEHLEKHKDFMVIISQMRSEAKQKPLHQIAEEALDYLVGWLASHVIESDRHLACVVQNLQAGMSLNEAKASASTQIADLTPSIYSILSRATLRVSQELSQYRQLEADLFSTQEQNRQAGIALSQQRNLLESLIGTLPDLIWLKNPDGVYMACNGRFEQFFGASESIISGKTDYDFVDRELADFFHHNDRIVIEQRQPSINEEWVTFADDGHRELLEITKTPMFNNQGELIGVLGIGHDITSRKKHETALYESEQRYREVFNQQFQFMALLSVDGRVVDVNDLVVNVQGAHREDYIGKLFWETPAWRDLPEWQDILQQRLQQTSQSLEPILTEDIYQTSSGALHYADASALAIRSDDGKVHSYLMQATDTTDRKRAEHELEENKRRLSTLMDNLPGMAYQRFDNDEWTIEFVSEGCQELTGYGPKSLLYNRDFSYADLIYQEDLENVRDEIRQADIEARPYKMSYRIVRKNGELIWVLEQGRRVTGPGKEPVMLEGLVTDINSQKVVEQLLQQRLDMEGTLAQVSASLTQSPKEKLKSAIDRALWRIAQVTNSSRCFLMIVDDTTGTFTNQHEWCAEGVKPQKAAHQHTPLAEFDDAYQRLKDGEILQTSLADDQNSNVFPISLRAFMQQAGDESLILIPMMTSGRLLGAFGLASDQPDQHWKEQDISLWRTLAEIFGSALLQKEADDAVRLHTWYLENLDRLSKVLTEKQHSNQLLHSLTELIMEIFQADRVWLLHPCDPNATSYKVPVESNRPEFPGAYVQGGEIIGGTFLSEVMPQQLAQAEPTVIHIRDFKSPPTIFHEFQIKSQVTALLHLHNEPPWLLGMHQCSQHREWSHQELSLYQAIAERIGSTLSGRQLLTQIRESESRYRGLVEDTPSLICHFRSEGEIIFVNDAYCRYFNKSPEELVGKSFYELVPESDQEQIRNGLLTLSIDSPAQTHEHRVISSDGSIRWQRWTNRAIFDANGAITDIHSVGEDVTERHQAEEQLRVAAAVFASTAEGVIVTDLDGRVLDVNAAFTRITGYQREDILNQNPRMLKSGRHDRSFYKTMFRSLEETGVWRGEVWNRRKDGGVYPELLTINPVKNVEGKATGYVGVFTDISPLKETEDRLDHLAHHDPLTELPNRLLRNLPPLGRRLL